MNPYFLPDEEEQKKIQLIQQYCRNEFALIRMTPTMLKKSIIDASGPLRTILRDNDIVNYDKVLQGPDYKIFKESHVFLGPNIVNLKTSFYRPETKLGDPRIWIYDLKKFISSGTLIYFTVFKGNLVVIPLITRESLEILLPQYFGGNDDYLILEELMQHLSIISNQWIRSVSPFKRSPKDVGETLENYLGISPNSIAKADFKGAIELKCKRAGGGNLDTLFSMVPNWDISKLKSSTDIMLKYGYPSNKYSGYYDLYVTVSNIPNNQGLFLVADDEDQIIYQRSMINGIINEVCSWEYSAVKHKLQEKHPKTAWLVAEEKVINGEIHFNYNHIQLTQRPIFSQFTTLINQGIITYDWRGRVRTDRTGYKDKGHCYRIAPRNRNLLFGETSDITL
ncbi:MvaI/BcnI family restriction endonuclease [Paenibacillus sp. MSJ-34]|uniref:MvaI/BcnI family restriction endonuclease n=1 Tax=Paenibacillus sp. MSJ-34 TaxID=2841529 RepID=UPI001C124FED|nr:MvaI/BcnI family restriction endonuclease [Paenibacillus sp. MSJ-34]MBU5444911.1 hypothetical protein [Paenibacillus sp. MSJ-34]